MRYEYTCTTVSLSSTNTQYTSCELLDGYQMQYLDRQDVQCANSNEAVTGFTVVRTGCSGSYMRYRFTCGVVATGLGSTSTTYSGCELLDGYDGQYLDRQDPSCGTNLITAFEVVRTGCSGSNMHYKVSCAEIGR